MHSLIVSQGRVADRTDGALLGARLAAAALADHLGLEPVVVGTPEPARTDDWRESLPAAHATLTGLRDALGAALDAGTVPLLVTNTCAASLGTLPTVAERIPDAVVLWIDAHGDFNTPATSDSGYLGGMVLAAACGQWRSGHGAGIDPERVMLVGTRDIDPAERELIDAAGVRVLPPAECTPDAVAEFVGDRPVWVHIDWDVLEPGYIPAAYKVAEGFLPHEIGAILANLPAGAVRGLELAEFEGDDETTRHLSIELILGIVQLLRCGQGSPAAA